MGQLRSNCRDEVRAELGVEAFGSSGSPGVERPERDHVANQPIGSGARGATVFSVRLLHPVPSSVSLVDWCGHPNRPWRSWNHSFEGCPRHVARDPSIEGRGPQARRACCRYQPVRLRGNDPIGGCRRRSRSHRRAPSEAQSSPRASACAGVPTPGASAALADRPSGHGERCRRHPARST